MNEIKAKYGKNKVEYYMKDLDKENKYYWTVGFILFDLGLIILFFAIGTNEISLMKQKFSIINNIGYTLIGLLIFTSFILWIYTSISILLNEFKKDTDKITWLFGVTFIPFGTTLYIDKKESLIE